MEASLLARVRGAMTGLRPPTAHEAVGNDECSYSFDSPWSEGGLYVNLRSFCGFGRQWVLKDAAATGNVLYAHHKWRRVPKKVDASSSQQAATTLGVGVEGGFATEDDEYDKVEERSLGVVVEDEVTLVPLTNVLPEFVTVVVKAVLDHRGGSLPSSSLEAWAVDDGPPPVSKYAAELYQVPDPPKISADPSTWRCALSGDTENLWVNLSDGYVGGGRDQSAWGGPKGSNGALEHFKATGYPLVVKLGTISATGAEVYSYATDEDGKVEDPKLAEHLAHFGIEIMKMSKTEKTTAELEVDANAKFEWSAIAEAGATLEPLSGPRLSGLVNLGNSCYVNSVIQLLLAVPDVEQRYHEPSLTSSKPSKDALVQLAKVGQALSSGDYAKPDAILDLEKQRISADDVSKEQGRKMLLSAEEATKAKAAKIAPKSFKALFGENHVEFATGRQQDAAEYLLWVLETLARAERATFGKNTVQSLFSFSVEEKTTCCQSSLARYAKATSTALDVPVPRDLVVQADDEPPCRKRSKTDMDIDQQEPLPPPRRASIPLSRLLETWASDGEIANFYSTATRQRGAAIRRNRLASRPKYLLLKISRYYVDTNTWEPKKLDVEIDVPETLDVSSLEAPPRDPDEGILPDEDDDQRTPQGQGQEQASVVVPDETIVAQLTAVGFAENGCKRACVATGNAGAEAAMEWVLAHSGDPDFADPLPATETRGGDTKQQTDPVAVAEIASLGFTETQAKAALTACDGSKERAADWIFSHMDDLDGACAAVLHNDDDNNGGAPPPDAAAVHQDDDNLDADGGPPTYRLVGFISHIGKNTGAGHYVAHIRKQGHGFVIFDDEKVAKSANPPLALGYVYLYQRTDLPDPSAS